MQPRHLAHTLTFGLGLFLVACSAKDTNPPRLHAGFEAPSRPVTTESQEAQAWFDQGMQLMHGGHTGEALRSFRAAGEADSQCAMAWWGVAHSGLELARQLDDENLAEGARDAMRLALERAPLATPVEQALIQSEARRRIRPAPADPSILQGAYADALEGALALHPNDADLGVLYAKARMQEQDFDLWMDDGFPKGHATQIVETLEHVLEIDPMHAGANHLHVLALQESSEPQRALESAERLQTALPGSGTLIHASAKVFTRIGKYPAATDANQRAIEADQKFIQKLPRPDGYRMELVRHVVALAHAAQMEGRRQEAIFAARQLDELLSEEFVRENIEELDGYLNLQQQVNLRFDDFEAVLSAPEPPQERLYSNAYNHYARGMAHLGLGQIEGARYELKRLSSAAKEVPGEWSIGASSARRVLAVALNSLEGELRYAEGDMDQAIHLLHLAAAIENDLAPDTPPAWMSPVRQSLGAHLLAEDRAMEAEEEFRQDLLANPGNGWGLLGLRLAFEAQGRTYLARPITQELTEAWRRAEVEPTAASYKELHGVRLSR